MNVSLEFVPEQIARGLPLDQLQGAAAFDELYTFYSPILLRIAVGKFKVPAKDAEDLVQDVFASWLANSPAVREIHGYFVGAICNASRMYHRRHHASPFAALADDDVEATPSDEDVREAVIRTISVQAALARLGESCRDTLERHYLLGESTRSIAETRNTSANYICRLLNYCRNRARTIFTQMHGRTRGDESS